MEFPERLAFLCHPYHRGGVTRWMADAAGVAARNGTKVWFVTVEPARPFFSSGGREPMYNLVKGQAAGVNLVTEKAGYEFELGTEAYRTSRYVKLINSGVPDGTPIIVSDDMAVWAAAAAVADRYPMVGVLHGDQDYYADKAARFEKQLAAAVCVSSRVKKRLIERCPDLDRSKIHVIPCGIELPKIQRREFSDGKLRLGFVGRITDYEKRGYDVVTICTELHKRGIDFLLKIVGSSKEAEREYGQKFREGGVSDAVYFVGWQPAKEVEKILSDTDIVILTSNSEGMPLVMMEALGAGCGFVGTRVSGIEDYEQHPLAQNCVRVYTVGDTAEGASQIAELAKVDARQRAKDARAIAETEFTMDKCLERYATALRAVQCRAAAYPIPPMNAQLNTQSHLRAVVRYIRLKLAGK
ncbi:MAG: glycosyltransferase family 4 protein [Taibaiella sp.]|nr:glycosyltransferase family 4 protein [Taibaiella sp.]